MTRAAASRRRTQEAVTRPASRLLSRQPEVYGCRSGRLPFVSVVTRFPSMLRSDHDDRGPADRVEDR
jgi:hypothetical protein